MYVFHFSLMKILNFLTLLFIVIWCLAVAASTNRLLHYKTTLTHTAYSGIGDWNGMEWSSFNGRRFIGIIIYCVYCENWKLFSGSLVLMLTYQGIVARGVFKNCLRRKVYMPQLGLVSRKNCKSEYEYVERRRELDGIPTLCVVWCAFIQCFSIISIENTFSQHTVG